ncbi:hypothetical protein EYF80_065183 [Liparis tanakae]|uniref:Uncharacterized protein n=1 Tax=Liparis tanakae TaxID=230148 RepID=A0A4Z2E7F4_9TELE|nr:hypothetical protein EYF80_065183 [Liparis tanakae]
MTFWQLRRWASSKFKFQDYGNNEGLCTARASEETTHESPPPLFPLTTRRQQSPIAPLQPALHDLLVPDIIIPSFMLAGKRFVYLFGNFSSHSRLSGYHIILQSLQHSLDDSR